LDQKHTENYNLNKEIQKEYNNLLYINQVLNILIELKIKNIRKRLRLQLWSTLTLS